MMREVMKDWRRVWQVHEHNSMPNVRINMLIWNRADRTHKKKQMMSILAVSFRQQMLPCIFNVTRRICVYMTIANSICIPTNKWFQLRQTAAYHLTSMWNSITMTNLFISILLAVFCVCVCVALALFNEDGQSNSQCASHWWRF